jgi:hypothetical protein
MSSLLLFVAGLVIGGGPMYFIGFRQAKRGLPAIPSKPSL